jgi:FkbM family methyltransferase
MVANFVKTIDSVLTKFSIKSIFKKIIPKQLIDKYYQYLSSVDLEKEALLIGPVSQFFFQKEGHYSFIDVGANHGAWSFEAAKHFHFIYAFECHPILLKLLQRRFVNKKHVNLYEFALSDRESIQNLFVPLVQGAELTSRASLNDDANNGFDQVSFEVTSRNLDSFSFDQIALIKIDVEGHEMSVLKGAAQTLKKNSPLLIIEIEDRHHPGKSQEIFDYLIEEDYLCYRILKQECTYLDRASFLSTIDQRLENNFIFIPKTHNAVLPFINSYLIKRS